MSVYFHWHYLKSAEAISGQQGFSMIINVKQTKCIVTKN